MVFIDHEKLTKIQEKLSEYIESLKDIESFKKFGKFPVTAKDLSEALGLSQEAIYKSRASLNKNYFEYELYRKPIFSDVRLDLDNEKLKAKFSSLIAEIDQWDNVTERFVVKNGKIKAYPEDWRAWFEVHDFKSGDVPMYYEDDLEKEENNPRAIYF